MPALEGQFLVLGTCTVAKDKVGLIRWLSVGRVKAQRFDDDLVALNRNQELKRLQRQLPCALVAA